MDENSNGVMRLNRFFESKVSFIEVNPGRIYLTELFNEMGEAILDLPIKKDDIWVLSYPRTGTHWAQELIWILGNKLDFEEAKKTYLGVRAPTLELSGIYSNHQLLARYASGNSVDYLRNIPSPRFARSHLPWPLLPRAFNNVKPKIIYTARNPKDTCVSIYHYSKLIHKLNRPFDEFFELFMSGIVPYGSYWDHVLSFWKRRAEPNVLFLKYEDMKRNFPAAIRKCAEFLEIDYELKATDIDQICNHLGFEKMQQNPAVNLTPFIQQDERPQSNARFIRKGQIGDWKNHFTSEMSQKFDEWIEMNSKETDLVFDYE